jgi:hypothetical protein
MKSHDMTLAGGASFKGGIFLAVAMVDRALKGSMAGERMKKRVWKRSEREGDELRDLKGREPFFSLEFYHSTTQTLSSQWVECNRKGPS